MRNYYDYLFAKPSFIGGIARVLDLGSTLNVYSELPSAQEADERAISSDWEAVGSEIIIAARADEKEAT
jgi:hypothetical protein